MKFQNPSLNSVLNGQTDERTSRKQYAPHFFKVGGIIIVMFQYFSKTAFEPRHEKINVLHMRKQRRRSASW